MPTTWQRCQSTDRQSIEKGSGRPKDEKREYEEVKKDMLKSRAVQYVLLLAAASGITACTLGKEISEGTTRVAKGVWSVKDGLFHEIQDPVKVYYAQKRRPVANPVMTTPLNPVVMPGQEVSGMSVPVEQGQMPSPMPVMPGQIPLSMFTPMMERMPSAPQGRAAVPEHMKSRRQHMTGYNTTDEQPDYPSVSEFGMPQMSQPSQSYGYQPSYPSSGGGVMPGMVMDEASGYFPPETGPMFGNSMAGGKRGGASPPPYQEHHYIKKFEPMAFEYEALDREVDSEDLREIELLEKFEPMNMQVRVEKENVQQDAPRKHFNQSGFPLRGYEPQSNVTIQGMQPDAGGVIQQEKNKVTVQSLGSGGVLQIQETEKAAKPEFPNLSEIPARPERFSDKEVLQEAMQGLIQEREQAAAKRDLMRNIPDIPIEAQTVIPQEAVVRAEKEVPTVSPVQEPIRQVKREPVPEMPVVPESVQQAEKKEAPAPIIPNYAPLPKIVTERSSLREVAEPVESEKLPSEAPVVVIRAPEKQPISLTPQQLQSIEPSVPTLAEEPAAAVAPPVSIAPEVLPVRSHAAPVPAPSSPGRYDAYTGYLPESRYAARRKAAR